MKQKETQIIKLRKNKITELQELGIEPYPHIYNPTHDAIDLGEKYQKLTIGEKTQDKVCIAGRLTRLNKMGKIYFGDISDSTGTLQIFLSKKDMTKSENEVLSRLDVGDIIGTKGEIFKTKKGEITVHVKKLDLLTKSVVPLPGAWYGVEDPDIRYRNRSLDMVVHPEVREVFIKRTKTIQAMREFLDNEGFLDVETPVLQPVYGGAAAKPFKTHINALKKDYYLSMNQQHSRLVFQARYQ